MLYAYVLLVGEASIKITLPAVLRLCGVPLGRISMSPFLSVIVAAPSDSGASHSPGLVLCPPLGVPPT